MKYRWSIPAELQIYRPVPATRIHVTANGGRYPVVNKLPDGRLVIMTKEGDLHVGERGRLTVSFSDDGGLSWTETRPVVALNPDPCHTAFGVTPSGAMIAFYVQPHTYHEGYWDPAQVRPSPAMMVRSDDGGLSWQEPVRIETPFLPDPSVHFFRRIIPLPDGTLLLNMRSFTAADGGQLGYNRLRRYRNYVVRSRDDGRTWGDPTTVSDDGTSDATFLRLPSGKLLAPVLHMPDSLASRAYSTWIVESDDDGYSWHSGRPVTGDGEYWTDLIRLRDGRLLLIFANRSMVPYGVRGLISRDDGKRWDHDNKLILAAEGITRNVGFPTAIALDEGHVLVVYHCGESSGPFNQPGQADPPAHYCGAVRFHERDLP